MVEIKQKEFDKLAEFIQSNFGIHLKNEKQSLLTARLSKVMDQKEFKSFSEYYNYVVSDDTGSAASELVDKITTNYTYFMREPEHFIYFKSIALPYWEKHVPEKDLRIWSAGCATGEEPYTIAFILRDYFKDKSGWDTKVLATDISSRVLQIARDGIYESENLGTISSMWKLNYFSPLDENRCQVADGIRNEVIFRRLNLMSPNFLFRKKFHIIFCRNVMIYFDEKTKAELVKKFYNLLEPGGYLFIGHTESLQSINAGFQYVKPAIYRRV